MEMKITRLCEMLAEDAGVIVEPHHLPEYRLAAAQVFLDRSGPTGPTAAAGPGIPGIPGMPEVPGENSHNEVRMRMRIVMWTWMRMRMHDALPQR
ncbi:hypothetical protein E4U54_002544, partial [Claviceps lovelessii]